MKNKIILIGLPGSGKSTLGKALAEAFTLDFVDLDAEVEKESGTTIEQIFKHAGEEAFRKIEAGCLRRLLAREGGMVLATGGGTPCFHKNLYFMNLLGLTVYLKLSFEELAERLRSDNHRPLLQGINKENMAVGLERKFAYRIPFYQKAVITFENKKGADWHLLKDKLKAKIETF